MSFITDYGNLTVGQNTQSSKLTVDHLNLGSNAQILINEGGTQGQVLSTDGTGNLSWSDVVAAPGPAGSYTQVQYNDDGTMNAGLGLTFDPTTRTLSTPTITVANVTVDTINVANASNVLITGTQLSGQALTSYGNGHVHFSYATGSGMRVTEPTATNNSYPLAQGTLPSGSTGALVEVLNPDTPFIVGDILSFSNDPTWILTVTNVTTQSTFPSGVDQTISWTPATRKSVATTPLKTTGILRVESTLEFSNLVISGSLVGTLTQTPSSNTLTINSPIVGSESQVITTQDGVTATGSSKFLLFNANNPGATPDSIEVANVHAIGNINSNANVLINSDKVFLDTNPGVHNTAIITSANGTITANKQSSTTATQFNSTGGYRRGLRFSHYTISATNASNYVLSSSAWLSPFWTVVEDNSVVLTPTNVTQGTLRWTNNTTSTLIIIATLQVAWAREGSGSRRIGFSINGANTNIYGLVASPVNDTDFLVQNTSATMTLAPGNYFNTLLWQNWGSSTRIGGAYGGMSAGNSTRLTFAVLN